jgi:hypothetical protein
MMNAHLLSGSRRLFMLGGVAALAVPVLTRLGAADALADEAAGERRTPSEMMDLLAGYGFLWSATSPATRMDDEITLLLTNRGEDPVDVWVNTIIMDHQAHHTERVIDETFTLAGGAARTLSATNAYGLANHFSTRMAASTGDPQVLGLEVTVADATGSQTASFNERAFWIKTFAEIQANAEARREERSESEDHPGH